MHNLSLKDQFAQVWKTLDIDGKTQTIDLNATLLPPHNQLSESFQLSSLPILTLPHEGEEKPELSLGPTLGQGGMGIVQRAFQTSLGRDVAVKRLRNKHKNDEDCVKLLQEAWFTGLLEHPNIVPVYLLGRDDDGMPMLVMKHLEGFSWKDILHNKAPAPTLLKNATDPLLWHIEILMQVCNAVHFAHSKGIIHRDLKPENIIVGQYGEVYLFDWGIAVSLDQRHAGRLPLAQDIQNIAGTPSYMPPEMAAGPKGTVSITTDVYLLGAILHELLTGHPPHQGSSLQEVLFQSFSGIPHAYNEETPNELIAICHKAMHIDPARRHPTAEAFRDALATFLRHQSSRRLSQEAHTRLELLKKQLKHPPLPGENTQPLYHFFGECRFGFQQAIREWNGNSQAHLGLQDALSLMADFELREGNAKAAKLLLQELSNPDPALFERLEDLLKAQQEQDQALEELEKIKHEHDLQVGVGQRSYLALLLAIGWGLYPAIFWLVEFYNLHKVSHFEHVLCALLFGCEVAIGTYFVRKIMLKNRVNRQFVSAVLLLALSLIVSWLLVWRMDIPILKGMAIANIIFFVISAMIAVALDMRIFYAALCHLAALIGIILFPKQVYLFTTLGNVSSFTAVALVWNPMVQHLHDEVVNTLHPIHDEVVNTLHPSRKSPKK